VELLHALLFSKNLKIIFEDYLFFVYTFPSRTISGHSLHNVQAKHLSMNLADTSHQPERVRNQPCVTQVEWAIGAPILPLQPTERDFWVVSKCGICGRRARWRIYESKYVKLCVSPSLTYIRRYCCVMNRPNLLFLTKSVKRNTNYRPQSRHRGVSVQNQWLSGLSRC